MSRPWLWLEGYRCASQAISRDQILAGDAMAVLRLSTIYCPWPSPGRSAELWYDGWWDYCGDVMQQALARTRVPQHEPETLSRVEHHPLQRLPKRGPIP